MENNIGNADKFYKNVIRIAVPVTLQSLLQSSFSVVDQLMIGTLGSSSIAGVGLGGKFVSLYSVPLSAIAAAAGIMISQYMGKQEEKEISRSYFSNLFLALTLGILFACMCVLLPGKIMWFYTKDGVTGAIGAGYLCILALSFLPMAVTSLTTTLLRCMEAAMFPLYASIAAVMLNTLLNYLLIFGKAGVPQLGANGAAIATVLSQIVLCAMTLAFFFYHYKKQKIKMRLIWRFHGSAKKQYLGILCPILVCEFLWSLGENVYGAIYGNMGTQACAAITLTVPIQTLLIGALSGLSQAAGIMIGKSLGSGAYEKAYRESKQLMWYGFGGSLVLSVLLLFAGPFYVRFYQVEPEVRRSAVRLLVAFAVIAPVKVQNMILGGGIIRSGGKTKYIMWVDFIGTWIFGVPLGLLSAFVWKLPIPSVYFILSLEECVRLGITFVLFRKRGWMRSLESGETS